MLSRCTYKRPAFWLALLSTFGCVPDFSPDPFNQPDTEAGVASDARTHDEPRDAGSAAPDSARPSSDVPSPPVHPCDLTGRWLMTERMMSTALGAQQVIRIWWYVELVQQGALVTFKRSVTCGQQTEGLPPFEANVDDSAVWPEYMLHPTYEGRTGMSVESGSSCSISIAKAVVIRGATVDFYSDLSRSMPTADQEAAPPMPGWEDWDEDGNPGISIRVSGTVSGTLYVTSRSWTEYHGTVNAQGPSFLLPSNWEIQRVTLGVDGSPLLATDVTRDPDEKQHFTEFARLTDEQANGDDATVCASVRGLASTLTPNAMK